MSIINLGKIKMDDFIDKVMKGFFLLRKKNSILRADKTTFYILNAKNIHSSRYYLEIGDFTIYSCKKDVYIDVNTILEMLGLRILSRYEYDQLTEKMLEHERKHGGFMYKAIPTERLPFENDFLVTELKQ